MDISFTAEEAANAVQRLKRRKTPGTDGLLAEHLKAGGEAVFRNILNVIPGVLKRGIIVPVYKELEGKILCVLIVIGELLCVPR